VNPPCASPLSDETLLEHWLWEPLQTPQADVEEHLLGCDDCSHRLARVVAIADGVRDVARAGEIRVVVPPVFLERVVLEGLRLREYRIAPGGSIECSVAPEDDVLVARLGVNVGDATRIDLVWLDAEGLEQERLTDVPVHAAMPEVVFVQRIADMRALPKTTARARFVATDGDGERVVAEYTFNHTPAG
jgi:predicted anti-sigma-YlaC factor YlaD